MKLGHLIISAALLSAATPYAFAVTATGGNTTNVVDGYRIHTFTNSATASNFVVTAGGNIEVLVVAGGGGGGLDGTPQASNGGGDGGLGGGGAGSKGTIKAIDADPNTGGGGGGAGYNTSGTGRIGGNGGSGIVIVRYLFGLDNANGATNVTATNAWLNGMLHADMPNTAVFVYWGQFDGGTNAEAWANTNIWAAPRTPGSFTFQATNLASDATWYYRYAVSNETGWTWALDTSVFITGEVWIEKIADASEIGPIPGTFTVHRVVTATNGALIVNYTIGGTANNGTDYTALSGMVTIPAGATNAVIEVMPIFDHLLEGPETVVVTMAPGAYVVGSPSIASLDIADYGQVTAIWDGGGVNALASNPANWVGDNAPITGDAIVLDATTNKNMTWDLNCPVQSWTQIDYTGTVTIATVYGNSGFTNLTILGDCVISNGVWTHTANTTTEAYCLRVSVGGDLIVGENALLDATAKGFNTAGYLGPGVNGSYGGRGSFGSGSCYGSIYAPVNLGSATQYGPGGGAIRVNVTGALRLDGGIHADAGPGTYSTGSGGSLYVTAGELIGAGLLCADGGVPALQQYPGGGGRVSLTVTNTGADFSQFVGQVTAFSGKHGGQNAYNAGAGTVYLRTATQNADQGTLIVDNGGMSNTRNTEIGSAVTDAVFGDVLIRKNGLLKVLADQTLTVSGVWSNGATFAADTGSAVIFAGNGSTSTLYGATTFMVLVCTNEGKTLLFPPNVTTAIAAGGALDLRGSATATNLFLRSFVPGQNWKLNVSGTAAQSVWYVDVQDSDASSGTQVTAFFSRDGGANTNWAFSDCPPGITNVWTGAFGTQWSAGENWHSGRIPYDEDFIKIPTGLNTYPVIDAIARTVAELVVETGASLNLNGYDMTVNGNTTIAGALICTVRETVMLHGDANFMGGAFAPASSTMILAGGLPQSVAPDSLRFHKIRVTNTNTVTFTDGFTAYELLAESLGAETRRLVFAAGKTVTLNVLALLCEPGTTNISLRSSADEQPWFVFVSNSHSVRGVDVKDSNAGAGQTLVASGSHDAGNNTNWDFNQDWKEWTGAAGNGNFANATNWWPAEVPDAGDWVRVDNALRATITLPVTLHTLVLGGGLSAAQVEANALVTILGDMRVLNHGSLTHSANADSEKYKLNIRVASNLTVEAGGSLDVIGKGYSSSGYLGPGANGSYGGRCAYGGGSCYGSITAPTNLGSAAQYGSGGGAIQANVGGTLRNDGLFQANGAESGTPYTTGSGGSIYLTVGEMLGCGTIRANGGNPIQSYPGGGGRVALVVTNAGADFSRYLGSVTALSGKLGASAHKAGPGTVYKQCAVDRPGRGTVTVDNNNLAASGYAAVPPYTNYVPGEVDRAVFHVSNAATLRLTDDFTLGDIWLDTASAVLDLGGYTLTVNTREHPLGPGGVVNRGDIIWTGLPPGVLIIVK